HVAPDHLDLAAEGPAHGGARLDADEGVRRPLLAADHRFEEEAAVRAPELRVRRDRRVPVGEDLAIDRDEVARARELSEGLARGERWRSHGETIARGTARLRRAGAQRSGAPDR